MYRAVQQELSRKDVDKIDPRRSVKLHLKDMMRLRVAWDTEQAENRAERDAESNAVLEIINQD